MYTTDPKEGFQGKIKIFRVPCYYIRFQIFRYGTWKMTYFETLDMIFDKKDSSNLAENHFIKLPSWGVE